MKRVILIHGWGGSSKDNWFPWLKDELEKYGYQVIVPDMQETDSPIIEKWVKCLSDNIDELGENTYFVGHSVGCQTILRYLEKVDTPVGGAIFVAGWFNLENMEDETEENIAKPWIEIPINIEKIKSVLPKSTLIISDNDDYGAFEENKQKFKEFVTKEVILHNAEHITGLKYPEILSETLSMLN